MSPFRAVAFDMDGVLIDTESVNVRAAFEAFEAAGRPLDPGDAAEIVGRHPVDYNPVLLRRHALPADLQPRLAREQNRLYDLYWRLEARLTDGAREALAAVRSRGLSCALATSSGRAGVEEALDRFGLRGAFDVTLSKDDVAARKPAPEIYLRAAELLGVPPSGLLVVEDSEYGVRAAKDAGARCVAVLTPHTPPQRIAAADAIIASLRELPPLL